MTHDSAFPMLHFSLWGHSEDCFCTITTTHKTQHPIVIAAMNLKTDTRSLCDYAYLLSFKNSLAERHHARPVPSFPEAEGTYVKLTSLLSCLDCTEKEFIAIIELLSKTDQQFC